MRFWACCQRCCPQSRLPWRKSRSRPQPLVGTCAGDADACYADACYADACYADAMLGKAGQQVPEDRGVEQPFARGPSRPPA